MFAAYPGLQLVPLSVQAYVAPFLKKARFVAIGTPFDGLDKQVSNIAGRVQFDRFFSGTTEFFDVDFLNRHYEATHTSPENALHGIVTTQPFADQGSPLLGIMARSARRVFRPSRTLVYHGGLTAMESLMVLLGLGSRHDGLVSVSEREFLHSLHLNGFNHGTQVSGKIIDDVLKFTQEII